AYLYDSFCKPAAMQVCTRSVEFTIRITGRKCTFRAMLPPDYLATRLNGTSQLLKLTLSIRRQADRMQLVVFDGFVHRISRTRSAFADEGSRLRLTVPRPNFEMRLARFAPVEVHLSNP